MKICFITGNYPPKVCGVGDYTYFLVEELTKRGNEVYVITSPLNDSEKASPANHIVQFINKWSIFEIPELLRILKERSPEVLNIQYVPHAFHPRSFIFAINILPLLLRIIMSNIKIVVTIHECHLPWLPSIKGSLMSLWHRIMLFLICTFSHKIVVTTKRWNRLLRRALIFKKTEWVPVGSNIPVYHLTQEEKETIRKKILGNKKDYLLITSFGTLHESKDLNLILNVLNELKTRHRIKYLWIGGKEIKDKLRQKLTMKIEESGLDVEFTGQLKREEVSKNLLISDLFLQSYTDGVDTRRSSLIAALEHGLPVITTYSEITEECFVHGKNIMLAPAGDEKELLKILSELINNHQLRENIAKNGRELFNKFFSWRSITDNLIRVFGENKS